MNVENPSPFLVQCFCHKPQYLPKGDESSWQKYTSSAARNATTIIYSIVTAKILMDIRNISAGTAIINLHPNARGRRGQIVSGNIRPVPFAVKPASSTTTTSITATTAAATKSATTHSLCGKPLPLQTLPCLSFSENMILSVCVIPRRLSSQLYPCFT